jgi:hypothetical protein
MAAEIVASKAAVGLLLILFTCFCSLPPNVLSEKKGDRTKDRIFPKAGTISGSKMCVLVFALAGLIIFLDNRSGRKSLHHQWTRPEVRVRFSSFIVCVSMSILLH